jgi:preprotein translocase subunit Sss1
MTTAADLTAKRPTSERLIEIGLRAAAAVGILTTVGLIVVLLYETIIPGPRRAPRLLRWNA